MFHYDAGRNGATPASGPTSASLMWSYTTGGIVYASPIVSDGFVFIPSYDGKLYALDEYTGSLIWSFTTGSNIVATPAVGNGMVYLSSKDFNVYIGLDSTRVLVLQRITGSLVWSFNTPGGSNATSPAIYNGVVYFGTGRGIVYARNATTGVQIWSYTTPTGGAVASSPALALGSKALFFGSNDRYLYALNMVTGAFLWSRLVGGQVSSSPAVADSRVFFGAKDAKVYAFGVIIPPLSSTLTASPATLRSASVSNLTVIVRNSTGPISGANLTLTSSAGGTFSQPVMTIPGTYVANFTAPTVSSTLSDVIQVIASAPGYLNAVARMTITVNPYPPLTVAVAAKPGTTTPGAEVLLMIMVTNGTDLIAGASLTMTSTSGGSFSGLTDGGNGNYTVIYTTPLQASTNVLTVQASKNQFSSAQG